MLRRDTHAVAGTAPMRAIGLPLPLRKSFASHLSAAPPRPRANFAPSCVIVTRRGFAASNGGQEGDISPKKAVEEQSFAATKQAPEVEGKTKGKDSGFVRSMARDVYDEVVGRAAVGIVAGVGILRGNEGTNVSAGADVRRREWRCAVVDDATDRAVVLSAIVR